MAKESLSDDSFNVSIRTSPNGVEIIMWLVEGFAYYIGADDDDIDVAFTDLWMYHFGLMVLK